MTSTSSSSKFSSPSTKHGVQFSTIEIREFPLVLGLNPSTSQGPPLEIGWDVQSSEVFDVELREASRSRPPRSENDLIIPVTKRVDRLLRNGFTLQEINDHTSELDVRWNKSYTQKSFPMARHVVRKLKLALHGNRVA